jgi:hypothetical protein
MQELASLQRKLATAMQTICKRYASFPLESLLMGNEALGAMLLIS